MSRRTRPAGPEDAQDRPRAVPTTGMRGGLGRTLLTAFLILTVVPLAVIGAYAVRQNHESIEREVGFKLLTVATLKGEGLVAWLRDMQRLQLSLLGEDARGVPAGSGVDQERETTAYQSRWDGLDQQASGLVGAAVLSPTGEFLWSVGHCDQIAARALGDDSPDGTMDGWPRVIFIGPEGGAPAAAVIPPPGETAQGVILCAARDAVVDLLQTGVDIGESGRVSLVARSGIPSGYRYWPGGELAALPFEEVGGERSASPKVPEYALYQNDQGDWVIGGFYSLPELAVGVLVEQSQDEVLASTERIVATLIALILGVALFTTAAAAVVIRQITRPVIDLTESAVAMAEGNLDQHLAVRSRDEIGILTYVFNEMAAELKSLYGDLEEKVIERTKRLQHANYQIQRRALHLQASQEVSQAITSVRDPELLLTRVTDLIRSHFIYSSVAVYLVAPGGGEARLQASSPQRPLGESTGAGDPDLAGVQSDDGDAGPWSARCWPGDGSVVGRAIRKGETQVHNEPTEAEYGWYSRYQSRVAIPLRMAERIVGAVAVTTTAHEGIQHDELEVLEGLANQVTIALENARAYERERLAMAHMEAAEAFKARFLGNMSRELREPLNTIIGFSRLLIKGIDGPLSDRQLEDLEQIHNDSQHLLFLINDILSISQIQAGQMALRLQPVDLSDLLAGVMPTAGALIRGRDITLRQEVPTDLPALEADPTRIRQILVHLLNNAAKFTDVGEIVIRAWNNEDEVYVSVSDTGIGIPVEDRERIFAHFEKGRSHEQSADSGIGLGLALCREYVELHGGRIWVDSDVDVGSTFTFSIPAYVPERAERATGGEPTQ